MAIKKPLSSLCIPETYSLQKGFLSQSQCVDFMQCRMKWLFRINGLTSIEAEARTDFGTMFHWLLCQVYKVKYPLTLKIQFLINHLRAQMLKTDVNREWLEYDLGVANVLLTAYMQHYAKDFERREYILVEEPIQIVTGSLRRMVKTDAAYYDHKMRLWTLEHKTRGRVDESAINLALQYDFQNLWTVTLLEDYFKQEEIDAPVAGVHYNIVRKPGIKQTQKETFKEFLQRLADDIKGRPEFYFIRNEVIYTKEDRERFRNIELAGVVSEIRSVIEKKSRCFRNSNACFVPYTCAYIEACSSGDYSCLYKKEKK